MKYLQYDCSIEDKSENRRRKEKVRGEKERRYLTGQKKKEAKRK